MAKRAAGASTPATVALAAAGVEHVVHAYTHDSAVSSEVGYGMEAAHALGVTLGIDPARVCKTLVVEVDGELAVAVAPVSGRLDLKAVGAALGAKRASMADATLAERTTGYVRGGISPIGQRKRLRTVVDSSALGHPTVVVSAGRRGLDVELSPADLVILTGAVTARVTAG